MEGQQRPLLLQVKSLGGDINKKIAKSYIYRKLGKSADTYNFLTLGED